MNLGDRVKDKLTGFSGVIVAMTRWINGCERAAIQPEKLTKEGNIALVETIDINQLELVKAGVFPVAKPGGGPMPDAVRR